MGLWNHVKSQTHAQPLEIHSSIGSGSNASPSQSPPMIHCTSLTSRGSLIRASYDVGRLPHGAPNASIAPSDQMPSWSSRSSQSTGDAPQRSKLGGPLQGLATLRREPLRSGWPWDPPEIEYSDSRRDRVVIPEMEWSAAILLAGIRTFTTVESLRAHASGLVLASSHRIDKLKPSTPPCRRNLRRIVNLILRHPHSQVWPRPHHEG